MTALMSDFAASTTDNYLRPTACFSVHARAEPGVMPRVLALFAKRGLVPSHWQSATFGDNHSELTIDIQMRDLGRETVDYIAACLRQIASVKVVLTS
jgi:acetolactate synthase small subunit